MSRCRVVNIRSLPHNRAEWPPDHVYVGRPSPWGNANVLQNPFSAEERADVIARYEVWVRTSTEVRARWVREHIKNLRGKTLVCYCAPKPCHGDVLARLAEAPGAGGQATDEQG
jgi:hypothetical protein